MNTPASTSLTTSPPGTLRLLEDTGTAPGKTTTETYQEGSSTRTVETAYACSPPPTIRRSTAICSPIADSKGTVFFKNDSAYLMALTSTVDKVEVTQLPDKMSYNEGEAFDPTGMELTVYYTNGESRVLPVSRTSTASRWNISPTAIPSPRRTTATLS